MIDSNFNHEINSNIDSDSSYLLIPSTTGSDTENNIPNAQQNDTLLASKISYGVSPSKRELDGKKQASNNPVDGGVGLKDMNDGDTNDVSPRKVPELKDEELDLWISHLTDRKWLEKEYDESYKPIGERYRTWSIELITKICNRALPIFQKESTLIEVTPPIIIVGDIHGQHENLLDHFKFNKLPSEGSRYLFLGDYVDRGKRSLEVILLLLCLKIKHPDDLFLLRGNHEIESINTVYGFASECQRRSVKMAHRKFNDVFEYMPIAALVKSVPSRQFSESYPIMLCMHGGISPHLTSLDDIRRINKPFRISINSGLAIDLMWADPDRKDEQMSTGFEENESRGISVMFGPAAVRDFMKRTKVQLIVRAHQVIPFGYELLYDRRVLTLFSAPNYCGEYDNSAAVMHVAHDLTCSFKVLSSQDTRRPVPTRPTNV